MFALIQMVILFTWSRSGMIISAFMSIESDDARSLIEFLAVGSAFGTIFAALTFSTAVFSLQKWFRFFGRSDRGSDWPAL